MHAVNGVVPPTLLNAWRHTQAMGKKVLDIEHLGYAEGPALREWAQEHMPGSDLRGGFFERGHPLSQIYRCNRCSAQFATIGNKKVAARKVGRRWRLIHASCMDQRDRRDAESAAPLELRDALLIATALADARERTTDVPPWRFLWPQGRRTLRSPSPALSIPPPTPAQATCFTGNAAAAFTVEAQLAALRRSASTGSALRIAPATIPTHATAIPSSFTPVAVPAQPTASIVATSAPITANAVIVTTSTIHPAVVSESSESEVEVQLEDDEPPRSPVNVPSATPRKPKRKRLCGTPGCSFHEYHSGPHECEISASLQFRTRIENALPPPRRPPPPPPKGKPVPALPEIRLGKEYQAPVTDEWPCSCVGESQAGTLIATAAIADALATASSPRPVDCKRPIRIQYPIYKGCAGGKLCEHLCYLSDS